MTTRSRCTHQRSSTCAGVRPTRSAIAATCSVRQVAAGAERAIGLERDVALLARLEQLPPVLERAELHLVRQPAGVSATAISSSSSAHVEVRDADRARIAALVRTLHPGPGPGRAALRPVDDVEVDLVDAEPLQAPLRLGLRVLLRRIELRRDEDLLARHAAVAQRAADALLVAVGLRGVDVAVARARAPSEPRSRTPARSAPARRRGRAAGSRCRRRARVRARPRSLLRLPWLAPRLREAAPPWYGAGISAEHL